MKKKESKTTSKEHLSKHPLKKRKKATVKRENMQKIQEVVLKPIQEYPPQPSMEIRKKLFKLCGRKSAKRKKAQMKLWDTPVLSLIDGTVSIIFISIMWLIFPYILSNETVMNCQVIYSQFGLAIHQNDHQARRRFVEWAQNEIAVVPDFHKRILLSDEAHFWLNGYVNKQNCRIWSEANPQVYVETPLHPEKLTVWCALWAGGIFLQKR
ncbi:transposable element Tc3 transposase [Trichonephila clavipes]|nr:transposable element Tc3 transposase [Trichonephila clavipes]